MDCTSAPPTRPREISSCQRPRSRADGSHRSHATSFLKLAATGRRLVLKIHHKEGPRDRRPLNVVAQVEIDVDLFEPRGVFRLPGKSPASARSGSRTQTSSGPLEGPVRATDPAHRHRSMAQDGARSHMAGARATRIRHSPFKLGIMAAASETHSQQHVRKSQARGEGITSRGRDRHGAGVHRGAARELRSNERPRNGDGPLYSLLTSLDRQQSDVVELVCHADEVAQFLLNPP